MNKIDKIIDILNSHTFFNDNNEYDELGEQDDAAAAPAADSSGGGGGKPGYPTVTKWESGVTRGPANQIGLTKWADIVKINRGKANTLL
jgi:hypothetical protein